MIRLGEKELRTVAYQSSRGNQLKWESDGIWYKADYTGYEGLAEYVVSGLLKYSNLNEEDYILYETEEIRYKKATYRGCRSRNFLPRGWNLITLERLFQNLYGQSLYMSIFRIQGTEARARFLAEQVEQMTGLKDFGSYLSRVLTIDALFLNEDRHMHNIAVLNDGFGNYHYCPVFDNGCALLSDTQMEYPMGENIIDLIPQARSKTLDSDFVKQLEAVENLYGQSLKFSYNIRDIEVLLENEPYYPVDVKKRVRDILVQQRRTYQYMFR